MNSHRLMVVVGCIFVASVLIHCSNEVGKDNGSSPSTGTMNNGGAAITTILPPDPEPTDDVSFANDIQPIFDAHCTDCHNGTLLRGGLDLTTGNSYDMLVNHPVSTPCRNDLGHDAVRVQPCDSPPCDPSQSQVWSKALPDARTPDGTRCLTIMPQGTLGLGVICPPLFSLLEQWIINGAPNN